MATETAHGTPQFPSSSGNIAPSTQAEMDRAVQELQQQKESWTRTGLRERIALLERLTQEFLALVPRWVGLSASAKGLAEDSPAISDEWEVAAWPVVMQLRQLRQSLLDIEQIGHPRIPGPVTTRPDGQVVAQVFPRNWYDRIFFNGLSAEIWMEPGVTPDELPHTQAIGYQNEQHEGKVVLVLGAGNVSSIALLDCLYKLFVENAVVLLKMNPVNAYLGPLLAECCEALIKAGFLRISYGGAEEGAYLCQHTGIDEIHITGSDKTFEAIVFGPGPEGAERKAKHLPPLLQKRITSELGNVSPIIVVPGPWSASDLAYQAEQIVSSFTKNTGFNCITTRVIIQHENWPQRAALLQAIRHTLEQIPPRRAFYPGSHQRHEAFLAKHPDAELYGKTSADQLPWTLIKDIDPEQREDLCFTTEAFCSLFGETALTAESIVDYIEKAVDFANNTLWGTLAAELIVHPRSLKDPAIAAAVERAIANLRFGTVGVNYWPGVSFALGSTTWGAFPGHDLYDIQSGVGVVHNTLMFSRAQKTVLRNPFRSVPTPVWFVSKGKAGRKVVPRIVEFEARPTLWKLPGILWPAIVE